MTKEELAAKLDGCEIGDEITKDEAKQAADDGLIVVFGYSDDCVEFEGYYSDEHGCYNGGKVIPILDGKCPSRRCEDEDCPYDREIRESAKYHIIPQWDREGYSWIYETNIPHATFDILEDGEKFCRGIVFHKDDTKGDPVCPPAPLTSVIQWMRYDGTEGTLPERGTKVFITDGTEIILVRVNYFSSRAPEWNGLVWHFQQKVAVGDLWAYLPMPPAE